MKASSSANSVQSGLAVSAFPVAETVKSRFLDGLERREVHSILAAATLRHYLPGSIVQNQGDPSDYFFLLTKGCARLFFITQDGRKVLLRWLPPGEVLGGAALLPTPSNYLVGAEMVEPSSAYVWQRRTIRRLAAQYPKLLENALPFAMEHLTWFLATHMALISHSARERLAHVLLSLAHGIGQKVPGGIRLDVTNEELASTANITPFTASRLLSEWQRNGAVAKSRGKLILRLPYRLFLHQV